MTWQRDSLCDCLRIAGRNVESCQHRHHLLRQFHLEAVGEDGGVFGNIVMWEGLQPSTRTPVIFSDLVAMLDEVQSRARKVEVRHIRPSSPLARDRWNASGHGAYLP